MNLIQEIWLLKPEFSGPSIQFILLIICQMGKQRLCHVHFSSRLTFP